MSIEPIETDRLILRTLQPDDYRSYSELEANSLAKEFLKVVNTSEADFLKGLPGLQNGYDPLAITKKSSGQYIGRAGVHRKPSGDFEVTVILHPDHWGYRYGQETLIALLQLAIDSLGAKTIAAVVNPQNARMISLLIQKGFHRIRKHRPTNQDDWQANHDEYVLASSDFASQVTAR